MTSLVTVFAPVTTATAQTLAAGAEELDGPAYAATQPLREAHGFGPQEDEDADYTALGYAGLAALLDVPGLRLVLAADVRSDQVETDPDSPFGAVRVTGLAWAQVQAWFADEPGALADLDQARTLAGGRGLPEVADDERVAGLLDPWDLLWYAPQELPLASGPDAPGVADGSRGAD